MEKCAEFQPFFCCYFFLNLYTSNNVSLDTLFAIYNGQVKMQDMFGGLGTWFGKATGISINMPRIKVSGFWSIIEDI